MTTANTDAIARDEIVIVDPRIVHPDPEQPRVDVDDELAADIAAVGVLQAITVRPHPELPDEFMIIDGERRWKGAVKAKLGEIPLVIRIDLEDRTDRLRVQLSSNKGKPLTAFEEAQAWSEMMEATGWSQIELAKHLSIPRSTVGDRIRLLAIAKFWRELIRKGTLGISHAPILAKYSVIPEKWQADLWKAVLEDYQVSQDVDAGMAPSVVRFNHAFAMSAERFMHPLVKRSGMGEKSCAFDPKLYVGPIVQSHSRYPDGQFGRRETGQPWAADPEIWKPLANKGRAEKAKRNKAARERGEQPESGSRSGKPAAPALPKLPDTIEVKRNAGAYLHASHYDQKKEIAVWRRGSGDHGRWHFPQKWVGGVMSVKVFDVAQFLAMADRAKMRVDVGQYDGVVLVTTDTEAHGYARDTALQKREAALRAQQELFANAIDHRSGVLISWMGAPYLFTSIIDSMAVELLDICAALGLGDNLGALSGAHAATVLEALALAQVAGVVFPTPWIEKWDKDYLAAQMKAPLKFGELERRPPEAKAKGTPKSIEGEAAPAGSLGEAVQKTAGQVLSDLTTYRLDRKLLIKRLDKWSNDALLDAIGFTEQRLLKAQRGGEREEDRNALTADLRVLRHAAGARGIMDRPDPAGGNGGPPTPTANQIVHALHTGDEATLIAAGVLEEAST